MAMRIIKEVCTYVNGFSEKKHRCVVRTNTYGKTIQFLNELVAEIKRDFPDIKDEDLNVVHFGGERYRKTFGIEFEVSEPAAGYTQITQLEQILA